MRRALAGVAIILVLAGCGSDLDPLNAEWQADGHQPQVYRNFADYSKIEFDSDGTVALGGSDTSALCGGFKVTVQKVTRSEARYRLAYPKPPLESCGSDVPQFLDVVVKGDALDATVPDASNPEVWHFKRKKN